MEEVVFTEEDKEKVMAAFATRKPVVLPTDTIYGIVAPAKDKKAVLSLYSLRQRDLEKPFIILISSVQEITLFGINLSQTESAYLERLWPNKVTVILKCINPNFHYLHRGTESLAFRVPDNPSLVELINAIGPIVAPSANIAGMPEAKNIEEAIKYFGNQAEYIDKGIIDNHPSTIISLVDGLKIIRQGGIKINKDEYFRPSINN
ncbi:MAG: L-threonylcarbamoyladenylate synthase [Minisyncoccus archaeiphilus]|jgi:L-threonylcarbamoyladenylate synthase|uniref:L-threonylcarbamoyladenylate synthase n=1 Tax=Minisyncoccus archaeiphilus TaxID=3238481 RepID=UPI002B07BF87|nr:MAG: L-threonylcarbamoyladenylate synthase [Candidatus Parcubacteria bacterium]